MERQIGSARGLGRYCHIAADQRPAALFLRLPILARPLFGAWAGDRMGGWRGLWWTALVHRAGARPRGAGPCRALHELHAELGAADRSQQVCSSVGGRAIKAARTTKIWRRYDALLGPDLSRGFFRAPAAFDFLRPNSRQIVEPYPRHKCDKGRPVSASRNVWKSLTPSLLTRRPPASHPAFLLTLPRATQPG